MTNRPSVSLSLQVSFKMECGTGPCGSPWKHLCFPPKDVTGAKQAIDPHCQCSLCVELQRIISNLTCQWGENTESSELLRLSGWPGQHGHLQQVDVGVEGAGLMSCHGHDHGLGKVVPATVDSPGHTINGPILCILCT